MGEFFVFVLIVFSAIWGSVFLGTFVKRLSGREDRGSDADAGACVAL